MSGNRTLHREQIGSPSPKQQEVSEEADEVLTATTETLGIWSTVCTNDLTTVGSSIQNPTRTPLATATTSAKWMIWVTGSEGGHSVRSLTVHETSLAEKQDRLEASALRLEWTQHCLDDEESAISPSAPAGENNTTTTPTTSACLGGSCLSSIRNYTGEDRNAGDCLLLSLDLASVVRLWNLSRADSGRSHSGEDAPHRPPLLGRFSVESSTGTTAVLLPPRLALRGDPQSPLEKVVVVAMGCLDGTVALVSTGVPIFNPHHQNKSNSSGNMSKGSNPNMPPGGSVVETFGSPHHGGGGDISSNTFSAADVPLALEWNPAIPQTLAAGHGNGMVHLYLNNQLATVGGSGGGTTSTTKHYRLNHLGNSPVRAIGFTTDGNLLIAGNDQGRLCVWDCSGLVVGHHQPSKSPLQPPALVHHWDQQAHSASSWILRLVPIDARRFCTLSADQTISVWNVGQVYQGGAATHTFQSNQPLWSLTCFVSESAAAGGRSLAQHQQQPSAPRLVAGSSNGWVEVFSLEAIS